MIRDHVNKFNESEKGCFFFTRQTEYLLKIYKKGVPVHCAIVPDVFRHFEHSNDGSYRDSDGKYA